MLSAILLSMTAVPFAVPAQQPPVPRPSDSPGSGSDVVVTGRRLSDTGAALTACLARHCPPDQDAQASMAHAENLFVAGRYGEARDTLRASLSRNRRFAKTYPVPVADLWRSEAHVSIHLGEADDYRSGELRSLDALRAGLPADDPRIVGQEIEVADSLAHLGKADAAISVYRGVARRARAMNLPVIEGYGLLRIATLYTALATAENGSLFRSEAMRAIRAISATTDPKLAPFREVASFLAAWIDAQEGDSRAADQLIASYRNKATTRPILMFAPPIEQNANERAFAGGEVAHGQAGEPGEGNWVDISFWIRPDGTVGDAGVLRAGPHLDRSWLKPVLTALSHRRYAPLALDKLDPGLLRVERYTRTNYAIPGGRSTGTRLRTREGFPRIEMLDLTEEAPSQTTKAAGATS